MIKVYHFILDHRVGGPHIYVRGLARTLAANVVSKIVTTGSGKFTDWALSNLRHQLKFLYPFEVVVNTIRICWFFRRRVSRKDVIFDAHGAANLAPIMAARILKVPLVWHFHETVGSFLNLVRIGKLISGGIPRTYVVVATRSKDIFSVPDAVYIPGSVDSNYWSVVRSSSGNEGDVIRVLSVGNLNPLKGFDILLKAMEKFTFPIKLTIVGARLQTFSEYAEQLFEQAVNLNNGTRSVEFIGGQSQDVIKALLARTDIFVLPSRSEACPIALLEAMSTGCACIATDVGDVSRILSLKGSGLVIKNEDPDKLAQALLKLTLIGEDARFKMGYLASQRVRSKFGPRQMADRHLKIYKKLIEKN